MPRCARIKQPNSMYHIMIRSISELLLFKEDADKDMYLSILKTAQSKYFFKIYAFCLMDNHAHFILDPLGGNISKIMHYVNLKYAMYYNAKYKRVGHLFQDRFKSKIIYSQNYLINLSAYIHANPNDILEYKNNVHLYKYSSLIDYMKRTNRYGILDTSYLYGILCLNNRRNLLHYANICNKTDIEDEIACTNIEFIDEKTEYRSERHIILRNQSPKYIINYVADYLHTDWGHIHAKRKHKYVEFRAICCFLLNCFCDIPQRDISLIFGNITQSSISRLSTKGASCISSYGKLLNSLLI